MADAQFVSHDDAFLSDLRAAVPLPRWNTWFSALHIELADRSLRILAPSDFHLDWVREHYKDMIEAKAAEILGPDVSVEYMAAESSLAHSPDPVPTDAATEPAPAPEREATPPVERPRFTRRYVFDNFVAGQSNRLALAAAQSVAEDPGGRYNPLFIHGGVGLGKTHLLNAIGHDTLVNQPNASILYTSSETFVDEFVDGIRRKRMDDFKTRYRSLDLLLLDDVQFFQGKERALEELFHTYNTLYELGHQIVLSCDRPPRDLGIEERLRSRFQWGLLVDIGPPDVETRLAILRSNAAYAPTPVPPSVLEFIAHHVTDNIRELEGALTRVTASAALTEQSITLELAKFELRDLIPVPADRPPTGPEIMGLVAVTFGHSIADLQGPSRRQPLVMARQIAMYLCRDLTGLSFPKIGKLFGGRDHTTVMHAVGKIERLLPRDPELVQQLSRLGETLCKK